MIQTADSFIIQKIIDAWRCRWEEYEYESIRSRQWSEGSGKLPNTGKRFLLRLAAAAVRDVKQQRDKKGIQFARKAMISTRMSLNYNGRWREGQRSDDLQRIIARNREHFDGRQVGEESGCVNEE